MHGSTNVQELIGKPFHHISGGQSLHFMVILILGACGALGSMDIVSIEVTSIYKSARDNVIEEEKR